MPEWLTVIVFFVVWIVISKWVLPKLGVPT